MVTKIFQYYTEFNLLYKYLKTSQNPKKFYYKKFLSGHFPKWYKNHYNDPIDGWIKSSYSDTFLLFYIVKIMSQKNSKFILIRDITPQNQKKRAKIANIICMHVFQVFLDAILIF